MKITSDLFDAYLKCPTKCWLQAAAEPPAGSTYSEWVRAQSHSYRMTETERLFTAASNNQVVHSPDLGSARVAKWRLASNVAAQAKMESCDLKSELHAVERLPSESRGKPAQFIPIRFVFRNKLSKDDKMLLAFDAFVLSKSLRHKGSHGKIIHGDNHAMLKLKTSSMANEARKRVEKIAVLLSSHTPPELVLNRHCGECEFELRCQREAAHNDDLSLLSSMTAKERKRLRNKGILTVTQLSYTFRPRRRPKHLRGTREKYHNSLKALAIRENKIHIAGSPELKIEGTPVFVDVEGLPDRDFYYLIGVRIGIGDAAVQHSLWADAVEDEGRIWRHFISILEGVEKPMVIHYGSYETEFFRLATKRYGISVQEVLERKGSQACVNVLSAIFGQTYFPTQSNGLKEIATWLGFEWTGDAPIGANSIAVRHEWERSRHTVVRDRLVTYNAEDCRALEVVTDALRRLRLPDPWNRPDREPTDVIYVESLKNPERKIGKFVSPFKEFEQLALAAWWNYQRDRIYVKSTKLVKEGAAPRRRERIGARTLAQFNKIISCPELASCPVCGGKRITRTGIICTRTLYDLHFGSCSIKRWVAKCRYCHYWCADCERKVGEPSAFWPRSHFGRNIVAYVLYEAFDLLTPFVTISKKLRRFFKLDVPVHTLYSLRKSAGEHYRPAFEEILGRLVTGDLLHADETEVRIQGKKAYVWVFTNLREVAYWYTQNREGSFLQQMLKDFNGVLVSDFYGAYDSLNCAQQKCLVHLIRDLNDEVLAHPYDEELKAITKAFATLLRPIVETVDRRGLKQRFLRKHRTDVNRFYRALSKLDCQSERAMKCKQRFERNREKLFTFLNHDGIPWNNNNAEHAIRSFAQLRDIVRGSFTEASVRNYLILLSIRQTCKYSGLDFFDFLRSGEKDVHAFEKGRRGRQRPTDEQKFLRASDSREEETLSE